MTLLRRTEELILLTILQLHENAYGVTIRRHLMEIAGEHFSFASVYAPLDRLAERGYAHGGESRFARAGDRCRFRRYISHETSRKRGQGAQLAPRPRKEPRTSPDLGRAPA